jgi:hypothetical protein
MHTINWGSDKEGVLEQVIPHIGWSTIFLLPKPSANTSTGKRVAIEPLFLDDNDEGEIEEPGGNLIDAAGHSKQVGDVDNASFQLNVNSQPKKSSQVTRKSKKPHALIVVDSDEEVGTTFKGFHSHTHAR